MLSTLAQAQSVFLLSVYKPIVMAIIFGAWAWVGGRLDKDLDHYFLPRRLWNSVQIAVAGVALMLWLLTPFWIGLALAVLLLGGGIAGYIFYRNTQVQPENRWTLSMDSWHQRQEQAAVRQAQKHASVRLLLADGGATPVPSGETPEAAAHGVLQDILDFALPRKADRFDLVVAGTEQVTVVVYIDGVKYAQPAPDGRTAMALVDYLKDHAGMDVADRRRRQSGQLLIEAEGNGRHTLGLYTLGSTRELVLTAHIDPHLRMALSLNNMGLLEAQKLQLGPVLVKHSGLVIVTAPPHQGLTTTLYSLIQQHDPYTQSVVTLEDQVLFEIEGVNHNTLEPNADAATVAQRIAAMLRQDPQVMLISKPVEAPAAKVIATTTEEVRVYLAARQDDTFAALQAWIKTVDNPARAGAGLAAIVAVRLVRKLCPTCRLPYTPDPVALKKLNLPPDRVGQLFKQSGQVMIKGKPQPCPTCLGMGYQGRVGVFEVMVLDDAARAFVAVGQLEQLRAHLRKQKMLWLQEAALAKVVEGTTSIGEVNRALTTERRAASAKSASGIQGQA